MNIKFISIGSYAWQESKLDGVGLIMKRHDSYRSSPVYYHVIDEQLFFLSAIRYGMEFKELTDLEIEEKLKDFQQERQRYRKLLSGRL